MRRLESFEAHRKRGPLPPLRTFAECAEMLGVSERSLHHLRASRPGFPEPNFKHNGRAHKHWYLPAAVRAWFIAVDGENRKKPEPADPGASERTIPHE